MRGGRAARGGGAGGSGRRQGKPQVTLDELNAELDAYSMQS